MSQWFWTWLYRRDMGHLFKTVNKPESVKQLTADGHVEKSLWGLSTSKRGQLPVRITLEVSAHNSSATSEGVIPLFREGHRLTLSWVQKMEVELIPPGMVWISNKELLLVEIWLIVDTVRSKGSGVDRVFTICLIKKNTFQLVLKVYCRLVGLFKMFFKQQWEEMHFHR